MYRIHQHKLVAVQIETQKSYNNEKKNTELREGGIIRERERERVFVDDLMK